MHPREESKTFDTETADRTGGNLWTASTWRRSARIGEETRCNARNRRVPRQMDHEEPVSLDAQCPHLHNVFGPAGLHSPSTLRHLASWSSWTYAVLYDLFCIHIGHPNPLGMHAVELLDIFQRVLGGQDSVLREWRAVRPCVSEFLGRPLAHVGRGGTAAAAASSAGPNMGPENASPGRSGRSVFFAFRAPIRATFWALCGIGCGLSSVPQMLWQQVHFDAAFCSRTAAHGIRIWRRS